MQHHARRLRLSLALLAACTPKPDPGDGTASETGTSAPGSSSDETPTTTQGSSSTGDSTGSSTGDLSATGVSSTTTVDPATSTSGPGDTSTGETTSASETSTGSTAADDTTSTSAGETDDLPDTTGGEVCEDPGAVKAQWSLEAPPALAGKDIEANCTVVSAEQQGPEFTVALSCLVADVKQPITVRYQTEPGGSLDNFPVGAERTLAYRVTQPLWNNEWLAITRESSLLLAGIRADSLAPPGTTTEAFFQESISLHTPCDAAPDRCGLRQPLALGLIEPHTRSLQIIKSGQVGSVGVFIVVVVWVEHASRLLEPIGCDDAPPRWIEAVLLLDASGA